MAALVILTRLFGCFGQGWPHTFFKDEDNNIRRAMRLAAMRTLDPDWFNKPALGYYVWVAEFGAWFGIGSVLGKWSSPEEFGPRYLVEPGPFLAIGRLSSVLAAVLTALVLARMGRRYFHPAVGIASAVAFALVAGNVAASQEVKKDVLTGLFVILAIQRMAGIVRSGSRKDYLWSGIWAGLGTATKYYPMALAVPLAFAHLLRPVDKEKARFFRRQWPLLVFGGALLAAFFVGSPYNFLNSRAFDEQMLPRLRHLGRQLSQIGALFVAGPDGLGLGPGAAPGAQTLGLAFRHLRESLWDATGVGPLLCILSALGAASGIADLVLRKDRDAIARGKVVLFVAASAVFLGIFMALANPILNAPRHLAGLHPLIALLSGCGLFALVNAGAALLRATPKAAAAATVLFSILLAVPLGPLPGAEILRAERQRLAPDPRVAALAWCEQRIPAGAGVISDRDWVPLVASVERCDANLARIEALDVVYRNALKAARALDRASPERATRMQWAESDIRLMEAYRVEWKFARKAAELGLRPAFDVLVLDKDWYAETLRGRVQEAGAYSPLWPRSPMGDLLQRTIARLGKDGAPEGLHAAFAAEFSSVLPAWCERRVIERKVAPEDRKAALEAELLAAKERFFLPSGLVSLVAIWRERSPVSEPWMRPEGPARMDFLVSARITYDNYLIPSKQASFPDWAEFYRELREHYSCWEFGSRYREIDPHRTVRVYDLGERTDRPEVRQVSEKPER